MLEFTYKELKIAHAQVEAEITRLADDPFSTTDQMDNEQRHKRALFSACVERGVWERTVALVHTARSPWPNSLKSQHDQASGNGQAQKRQCTRDQGADGGEGAKTGADGGDPGKN